MSKVNMANPKVVQNFLISQAKEGLGTFALRENVVIFRNNDGLEMICPDEMQEEKLQELGIVKNEKKLPTLAEKPVGKPIETTQKVTQEDKKDEQELRKIAQELKIRNWHNKSIEILQKEVDEALKV